MTFEKIKQYPAQISSAFKRFPVTIGFLTFITLLTIGTVQMAEHHPDFMDEYYRVIFWMFTFLGLASSISVMLEFAQERYKRIHFLIQFAIYGGLALIAYLSIYVFVNGPLYLSAIGPACVLSILLVPSLKEKNDIFLWNFLGRTIKALFTAIIIAGLFLGGLALLIVSCEALFDLDLERILYQYVMQICWGFVAPIIALAGMPNLKELEEEKPLNKFISGAIHFLFIPVLTIFLIILYIFGCKTLMQQYTPHYMVTLFVSIAAGVSIIISLLLYPAGQKSEKSFDKYFLKVLPVAVTPLLFLMVADVLSIIDSTHLDGIDIYLLILNLWFFGEMAILFIPKIKKKVWWTLASLCLTYLVTTCSPYNVKWLTNHLRASTILAEKALEEAEGNCDSCQESTPTRKSYSYYSNEDNWVTLPENRSRMLRLGYHNVDDSLMTVSNDTLVFTLSVNDSLKESFSIALSQISVPDSVDSDTLPPLELNNQNATLLLNQMRVAIYPDTTGENNLNFSGYLFLK